MVRFLALLLFLFSEIHGVFQLADYDEIVIATDLEPDDVLALKIIFDEANRLYCLHHKYPIQMVIVGEGNSAIKKARMETLLCCYYNVPVKIEVKEGRSTLDNLFPYDGEELDEKFKAYPFPHQDEGTEALIQFVKGAKRPLIIQLKPVQELAALSFDKALSQKSDLICYGSFNLRKALDDKEIVRSFHFTPDQSVSVRLQIMLDQFSKNFKKIGIVETYGVLGNQGSVYCQYPWTHPIAERIRQSNDPFFAMFRTLSSNWNKYKFSLSLSEITGLIQKLSVLFPQKKEQLSQLHDQLFSLSRMWCGERFLQLTAQLECLRSELLALNNHRETLDKLERELSFAHKVQPCAGLQFTLSDVILALALIDPSLTASPVKVTVNEIGFLQTTPDPKSNVYYYDRKEYQLFVELLLSKLCIANKFASRI